MRFTVLILGALTTMLGPPVGSQPPRTPSAQDFAFPKQDTEEKEGEVVWLQGAILRGNPAPYRNPKEPLAAYENGLLDDQGELWTFLDTPKGRELRYNPDLRGKRVYVDGWIYAKSHILEVESWRVGKHKVRTIEEFEPPEKLPFDPNRAETIESIPPIPLQKIDDGSLLQDLWLLEEGYDTGIRENRAVGSATETNRAGGIDRLLDNLEKSLKLKSSGSQAGAAPQPPTQSAPESMENEKSAPSPSTGPPKEPSVEPGEQGPGTPPTTQGASPRQAPVSSPEEFDAVLQKELIDQISPGK